jgi:hypothetical protein
MKGTIMADSSPLAGLLDRAGKVFSLAGKLGRAFHEDHQRQAGQSDPAGWNRHTRRFEEFCASLLGLRDAMESPSDEFAPIAKPLLEADRVAERIRDGMQRTDGRNLSAYQDYYPDLNSVCEDGWRAVREVARANLPNDPFGFVDKPLAKKPSGINTTPAHPKPPIQLVEAAMRDVPSILADVPPRHDGAIELVASHLAKCLQHAGHTLSAAQWAVHESVRAGRLQPGLIETELPSIGRVVGQNMRHWGGRDNRRMEWTGGGKATVAIPKDKPAPFDSFKVTATESLWAWWRSSAVETSNLAEPTSLAASTKPTSGAIGPDDKCVSSLGTEFKQADAQSGDALVTAGRGDKAAEKGRGPASDAPAEGDADASTYDVPQVDEYDNRAAWWVGKRIYLGNDTQISRLFWLLAKPVGRAHSLGDVQRALEGMETSADAGSTPDEIERAGKRLRKVVAKLRAALRVAELDAHFVIHRGGTQKEPEYSFIPRFPQKGNGVPSGG